MSSRITRSSARQAASQAANVPPASTASGAEASDGVASAAADNNSSTASTRKRKASASTSNDKTSPKAKALSGSADRRSKRQKVPGAGAPPSNPSVPVRPTRKGKAPAVMDTPDGSDLPSIANAPEQPAQPSPSSRKSSRGKKATQGADEAASAPTSSSTRRSTRNNDLADPDTAMTGTDETKEPGPPPPPPIPRAGADSDDDNGEDDDDRRYDDEDDFFGGPGAAAFSGTIRALTGMMTGFSSRLRDLLNSLRQDDPSMQLIALQEFSEILLVSNEDNLSGQFSPDTFVKELVVLMNKEESPEIMLLACRCLANLMEALPASVANVVYGGAVPVLCQKLLEISFIDLAEQALSTLEKISAEYPGSIVREGGLTACLSYLDFFPTSTQRTAVTTAANCCRNLPDNSFNVVRDVMPTLLNVLASSDQRVVEQASLCVSGIVDCFGDQPEELEELASVDLLRAVLRLLVPGTTNLIASSIHTQFLRVLALTARASPRLSAELFKLNVVETLYQMLTGVSPPSGTEDVASKLDSVVIMQALIHRPRDQVLETLNVICELLPSLPDNADPISGDFVALQASMEPVTTSGGRRRRHNSRIKNNNGNRVELLKECQEEVRRFALILFPTLTDAYSSTVNLAVRQRVLAAQLKMLSNLDRDILAESLVPVPYASFLASILSQRDHPSLVMLGLQATELLLNRLDDIYRYQFYREGVISEITSLANEEDPTDSKPNETAEAENADTQQGKSDSKDQVTTDSDHDDHDGAHESSEDEEDHDNDDDDDDDEDNEDNEDNEDDEDENDPDAHPDDVSPPGSSHGSSMSLDASVPRRFAIDTRSMKSRIRDVAKRFVEKHECEDKGQYMRAKAQVMLTDLSQLAADLEAFYRTRTAADLVPDKGRELFTKLASYFDANVLENVTSAELLASGLVRVLLEVFSNPDENLARQAQSTFLEVFMGYTVQSKPKTATADSPVTPFSVMVHKLQDLLSRSEHFEVITVHQNTFDGGRSSPASMLGKQIRLRLTADDESDIPKPYRNIMVSIHAIATFKALDEYLRPRISLSDRTRISRRDGLSRALAAMAGTGGLPRLGGPPLGSGSFGSAVPPPPPPPAAPTPSSSRSGRKSKSKPVAQHESPPATMPPSESSREKGILRRSTRRQTASDQTLTPTRPPPAEEDGQQDTLECADEKQLTDDDDEMADDGALDAIVGELQDDMDEDEPPSDPSAVNMEVATGGQVTARKEDGTKVSTPGRRNLTSRTAGSPSTAQGTPTPASSSKSMSYASALQTTPNDWHIGFTLNGKVVPNETTIYRAVHTSNTNSEDGLPRNVWSATHDIKFRKVPGPPPPEAQTSVSSAEADPESENGLPGSLSKHPTTASILQLLNVLHDLNANIEDVLIEKRETVVGLHREPLSQFVNTKLTAKLNRQLEEPLIVASNCLPGWSEDLARLYPFLFPFETRHLFLQSTSFGYARSMARWQNTQGNEDSRRDRYNDRPYLGRLQRQKVRISRSKILESALKVMDLYGASQSILEVEYFEEVGTGLGPTLEFYSTVSMEFSKKKLRLWRDMDASTSSEFASGHAGLFPRPLSDQEASTPNGQRILHLFKMLGKFVARSMLDSRIVDIHFNPIFFRIGETNSSGIKPSLASVKMVDPGLARSLMTIKNFALAKRAIDEDPNRTPAQKVADLENIVIDNVKLDDLCLDFTLPGYPEIELEEGGSHKRVTIDNVASYLEKVVDVTLGSGVRRQVDAFRAGFSTVFPYSALSAFTPEELVNLFGKADEDWSLETLVDSIKADHGFNMDSPSVRNLLHLMSNFSSSERRDFLQFTTGSPKLPIGGFKSLTPMFTVVCKPSEEPYTSDDYLPSVMTCVNYLKLPDYSSIETMKKQLSTAMKEGQGAFHLS
ncbi:ubiquitin fusion degradation protein C12B10.01c-like protein [Hapsidospora chrysogenum ATCC 11550]|uniref:HECT-type E3 ubiquitin transferase n=1 Tax=Hapsidospora chrysogenum (strain ATCC 11550 / CBS 779.69 / DSM 880 / IAM 14645 / JCM 23072 / IMI 49137) TaxID=857340 RepID=A0A086T9Q2_HAPC1|nr:ubiquitin fusion degradation protein C12B10.01c-like protein [Hapsidospora chrysogenum ATCC 11550]